MPRRSSKRRVFGPLSRSVLVASVVAVGLTWVGWSVVDRWPGWRESWTLRGVAADLRWRQGVAADRVLQRLVGARDAGVPWLLDAAASPDPTVRARAFRGLGELRPASPAAVAAALAGLDDPDPGVRDLALTFTEQIGPDAVAATDRLVRLTKDPRWTVRYAAARALNRVNHATESVYRPVYQALLTDPDPAVLLDRWSTAAELNELGPRPRAEAILGLIGLLDAADRRTRRQAVECLHRYGPAPPEAVPALTQALDDTDPAVRCRAAAALHEVDGGSTARARSILQDLSNRRMIAAHLRGWIEPFLASDPAEVGDPTALDQMLFSVAAQLELDERQAAPPREVQQP